MNNQYESNTIKALHHESLQAGTEIAAEDLRKTREALLIEIHAAARMPPLGQVDGSFVLANTIAKYASLQVIISKTEDKQQIIMIFMALAMVLLAIVQIVVAIFNK